MSSGGSGGADKTEPPGAGKQLQLRLLAVVVCF